MRKMEFWGLPFGLLYFLTYSFTKTRLFVGLKTWPHSHLPVSDVSEYPPPPPRLVFTYEVIIFWSPPPLGLVFTYEVIINF